jgi:hypothetical protein
LNALGTVLLRSKDEPLDRDGFNAQQVSFEVVRAFGARPYADVERPVPAAYLDEK